MKYDLDILKSFTVIWIWCLQSRSKDMALTSVLFCVFSHLMVLWLWHPHALWHHHRIVTSSTYDNAERKLTRSIFMFYINSRIRDWGWKLQACLLQRHQQHPRHVVHHGGGSRGPLRSSADDFCVAVHGPRQAQNVRPLPLCFVSTLLRLVSDNRTAMNGNLLKSKTSLVKRAQCWSWQLNINARWARRSSDFTGTLSKYNDQWSWINDSFTKIA